MLETLDIVQEQVAQDGKVVQLEQDHQKEQVKKEIHEEGKMSQVR